MRLECLCSPHRPSEGFSSPLNPRSTSSCAVASIGRIVRAIRLPGMQIEFTARPAPDTDTTCSIAAGYGPAQAMSPTTERPQNKSLAEGNALQGGASFSLRLQSAYADFSLHVDLRFSVSLKKPIQSRLEAVADLLCQCSPRRPISRHDLAVLMCPTATA